MTEERNRRRAEDSRRMLRFYAGMQRVSEIREERERKAAREASEAEQRAAHEREAQARAVREECEREAFAEYDRETAQREAAERTHAEYERASAKRPNGWMRCAGQPNATNNSRAECPRVGPAPSRGPPWRDSAAKA
jgi:hypothetical protein